MIPDSIKENRVRVVKYIRENPEGFLRIRYEPVMGHGRCLVGMICEALDNPLEGLEPGPGTDFTYTFTTEKTHTNCDAIWWINDRNPSATWDDLADALESAWKDDEDWVQVIEFNHNTP